MNHVDGLELALRYIKAQHVVWDNTPIHAYQLLRILGDGIDAMKNWTEEEAKVVLRESNG